MLETHNVGGRAIELDVHLLAFERQVERGDAMNVGALLAVLVVVVMLIWLFTPYPSTSVRRLTGSTILS